MHENNRRLHFQGGWMRRLRMKTVKLVSFTAATVVACAIAAPALANTWDFVALSGGLNQPLGSTFTFSQGGQTIEASALIPGVPGSWTGGSLSAAMCGGASAADPCLYSKGAGEPFPAQERGLGLIPNVDQEIFHPDGIGLQSSAALTDLTIGSVQKGESWQVQSCLAGFVGCVTIDQGIGSVTGTVDISGAILGGGKIFVIDVPCADSSPCMGGTTDVGNNILITSVTTPAGVPEPATLALFGLGLLALALVRRGRAF
jgi:hypothetical protein